MRDEDPICRNLKVKQDAFFRAAERAGLTMGVLAAETGISVSTLQSYRTTNAREPSIMSLATLVKLARVAPPELVSLLVEDSGCVLARSDPASSAWLDLGERAGALAGKICRYQRTGNMIDHVEDADLRSDLITIVSEAHTMIGRGS